MDDLAQHSRWRAAPVRQAAPPFPERLVFLAAPPVPDADADSLMHRLGGRARLERAITSRRWRRPRRAHAPVAIPALRAGQFTVASS
jgi:hypothetical protein